MTGGRTTVLDFTGGGHVATLTTDFVAETLGQSAVVKSYQVSVKERCAAGSLFSRLSQDEVTRAQDGFSQDFNSQARDTVLLFSLDGVMPGAALYVTRTITGDYNLHLIHTADAQRRNFLVAAVAFRPCLIDQGRALAALTGTERQPNFSLPGQGGYSDLQRQLQSDTQVAQVNRALRVIMGR